MKIFGIVVLVLIALLIKSSYEYDYRNYGHEIGIYNLSDSNIRISNEMINGRVFKDMWLPYHSPKNQIEQGTLDLEPHINNIFEMKVKEDKRNKTYNFACKLTRPQGVAWCKFMVEFNYDKSTCRCDTKSLEYQKTKVWNLGI
jgi:hypothetical protein